MRKTWLLLFTLLAIGICSAQVTSFSMNTSVDASGDSYTDAVARFENSSGKDVSFYFSGGYDYAGVNDGSGLPLDYRAEVEGNFTKITVTVPTDYVELELWANTLTSKEGAEWAYLQKFKCSERIGAFSANLLLPANARLEGANGAVTATQGGLLVSWDAEGVQPGVAASMNAAYSLLIIPMGGADYLPYFLVAGALVTFVLVYLSVKRALASMKDPGTRHELAAELKAGSEKADQRPETQTPKPETRIPMAQNPEPTAPPTPQPEPAPTTQKQETIPAPQQPSPSASIQSGPLFKTLDETDKEIILEIERAGGKTTQAHLHLYTHVPKATLSRRLASMENKGIIVRSQKGNRNLVTLGDVFKG